jgi:hypothetical protein
MGSGITIPVVEGYMACNRSLDFADAGVKAKLVNTICKDLNDFEFEHGNVAWADMCFDLCRMIPRIEFKEGAEIPSWKKVFHYRKKKFIPKKEKANAET